MPYEQTSLGRIPPRSIDVTESMSNRQFTSHIIDLRHSQVEIVAIAVVHFRRILFTFGQNPDNVDYLYAIKQKTTEKSMNRSLNDRTLYFILQ